MNRRFLRMVCTWTGLLLFLILAIQVWTQKTMWLDEAGFSFARSIECPFMTQFFLLVTFIGSSACLLPANILLVVAAVRQRSTHALRIAFTSLGSLGMMYTFKYFFARPRPSSILPEIATGYSFPSGHTLNSTVFFGVLFFYLYTRSISRGMQITLLAVFSVLILFIGFSRVYLHVHYTTDVVAGLFLGISWLSIALSPQWRVRV